MPQPFLVYGTVEVNVTIEVYADDLEQALDVAAEEFGGIDSYAGNGGCNKMIGVCGDNESIDCPGTVEWDNAETAGAAGAAGA